MKYTPDEVGRMLGNRVMQPHYAEWLTRRAIDHATLQLQDRIAHLVRTAENVAEWLARYSDQGQHRRLNGPSAGDAFDAAQSLRDAIATMRSTAEKEDA